jgi:putative endonuclease
MFYVYIIQSTVKNWKYIGVTEDIQKRLLLHNSGATKSTKPYRPLKLIYSELFNTKQEAIKKEIFLKKNFKAREAIYLSLGFKK